jgi:dihydrofolate reductase
VSKLRCSITVSLDGFVAGPNQGRENPLGVGGEQLHEWLFPTKTFVAMHGEGGGGETGVNDDAARGAFENIGATIMGRNMFGPVRGAWETDRWKGWWGDEPPFHHPVFVLTHHARPALALQGTTFHFVTDGIESALAHAKQAAAGKDVAIGGGARAVQQYLAAGLLDELDLHVVPRLLGGGERLLANVDPAQVKLDLVRTIGGPGVTHMKYRVRKAGS